MSVTVVWIYYKAQSNTQVKKPFNKANKLKSLSQNSDWNSNANNENASGEEKNLKVIYIMQTDRSNQIKEKIYNVFGLSDTNNPLIVKFLIRLRKLNGCFVPINEHLEGNTKQTPYLLETYLPIIKNNKQTLNSQSSLNFKQVKI